MSSFSYKRIVVIGTTSAGKSTLAEQLARRLDANFIELDALHWEADWAEASLEVFRERVEVATKAERWIVAGNYHVVRDLIWPKAEAVMAGLFTGQNLLATAAPYPDPLVDSGITLGQKSRKALATFQTLVY